MQSSFIVLFIKFMKLCFENIESFVIFFVVIFCQNNSQFNEIYEIINVFDEINFPKWSKIFDTKICELNKIFFAWGKSRHVFFVFSIQKQRNFLRWDKIRRMLGNRYIWYFPIAQNLQYRHKKVVDVIVRRKFGREIFHL